MADDELWILPGQRTPFTRVDGALAKRDAISLGVPLVQGMGARSDASPELLVWGAVAPSLGYSNLAREVCIDAGLQPSVPALSTVMACSTSMAAVFNAAGVLARGGRTLALCGGSEAMSRVQIGVSEGASVWLRRLGAHKGLRGKLQATTDLSWRDIALDIPSVQNRATGKSMGEHCEEMAKTWAISREEQDALALASHRGAVAGQQSGFFDDLVFAIDGASTDAFPRAETSEAKLATLKPAFDREAGTITPGNASPLTDGAAGVWLATTAGLERLRNERRRVRLLDWEVAAVDVFAEGLLMAPAYAIPALLARHDLGYDDIGLWEIHEAFAAQLACHFRALESREFLRERVGIDRDFGVVPKDRVNPNGGSVALGHPFAATGARILSQAAKELAERPAGTRALVSICADGGLGTVALLEAA